MYYKNLFFICFSLLFSFFNVSSKAIGEIYQPKMDYIEDITLYNGDSKGNFKNDLVVISSDGSAWKVHPKDREKLNHWKIHDIIQVWARTSFYWFKQEHKFKLYNISLDDSVRVMLVKYPSNPLYILETETRLSGRDIITHTYKDQDGNIQYIYQYVDIYEKKLYLSDKTIWILSTKKSSNDVFFNYFNQGDFVYVGSRCSNEGFKFFIASGIESQSEWAWTTNQIED